MASPFQKACFKRRYFHLFRIVGARNVVSKLTFNILLSFLTQQFLLTDINSGRGNSDFSLEMVLFQFHWDHWLVCEMLQWKLHCLQNVKGLGLNKPRQKTHPVRVAPPGVCRQNRCHSGCPACPQDTGFSSPSSCSAQLGPHCPRWFGVLLPRFKHSLNKRPCRFLLGLAESRCSINICWMRLIILMKRTSFFSWTIGFTIYSMACGFLVWQIYSTCLCLSHPQVSTEYLWLYLQEVAKRTHPFWQAPLVWKVRIRTFTTFHLALTGGDNTSKALLGPFLTMWTHTDHWRKMEFLNQFEWPAYMCRQPWWLFLHSIECAHSNVVPTMLLFSFKSKISFRKLEISDIISHPFFPLAFQKSCSQSEY